MMEASSNTLFLMDQRPTSVKAVRKALELCARCSVAAHPFLYAVNRCSRKALLSSIDISCALNGVMVAELKEGGPAVAELMSSGLARELVEERNDLCLSLNDFLGTVIPAALGGTVPDSELGDSKDKPKSKAKRKSLKRRGRAACL
jgi:pilus assembly protein CpaE